MDQSTATTEGEAVPASTEDGSQDTATCTPTQQKNDAEGVGGGGGEGGKPAEAVDDTPEAEDSSSVDNDMLETGGDAAVAADGGSGKGQPQERRQRPPRVGSVRQGRKAKRKAEWKAKKARMKENKLYERRLREEAARREGRELPADGVNYRDLPRQQWSISQKINHARRTEFEESSARSGYRVCIDMAFDHLMLEKAQASVGQQVMYAYSANRKAVPPCRITLSGLGAVMRTQIGKLSGFETWLGVTTDSRCYTEIFDKEELVYLTADSPDTITQLERGKVYILGGLVDRNAHKGLCFKKATDQGIATAKLPIKRGDLNGAHTKVLATNHVFDILVQAMGAGGNLEKIEGKTLPPRKRAGWAGGDDRGPCSKPAAKQADHHISKEKLDPSSVEKSDQGNPKDGGGCGAKGVSAVAGSSAEDRGACSDPTPTSTDTTGHQKHGLEETDPDSANSARGRDRGRDAGRGSAGEVGVKGKGEEGATHAGVVVAGTKSGPGVVKRAVEERGGVSSSAGVDAACKRGRTETDGSAGVASHCIA